MVTSARPLGARLGYGAASAKHPHPSRVAVCCLRPSADGKPPVSYVALGRSQTRSPSRSDASTSSIGALGRNNKAAKTPSPSDSQTSTSTSTSTGGNNWLGWLGHKQAGNGNGSPSASVLQGRFMLPAAEVKQLLAKQGTSMEAFLMSLIGPASMLARPPVSGYRVGAAGLGASGAVYIGVNLEFPGAPLNNSVHAEQFLVVNAISQGEEALRMLAVSAAPCGHCRQFYAELHRADEVAFLFGANPRPRTLDELLPGRFGPQDLSPNGPFPLLMQPHQNKLQYSPKGLEAMQRRSKALEVYEEGPVYHYALFQEAIGEALEEACKAYSPYTSCPSGAVIITHDGNIHSGGSIESAAYNPSLSPFHTAYIAAVAGGLKSFSEIREVVLAEIGDAPVQQRHNVQLLLNSVAPQATLTVLELQRKK